MVALRRRAEIGIAGELIEQLNRREEKGSQERTKDRKMLFAL